MAPYLHLMLKEMPFLSPSMISESDVYVHLNGHIRPNEMLDHFYNELIEDGTPDETAWRTIAERLVTYNPPSESPTCVAR